jgi:hypothetical protein
MNLDPDELPRPPPAVRSGECSRERNRIEDAAAPRSSGKPEGLTGSVVDVLPVDEDRNPQASRKSKDPASPSERRGLLICRIADT